MYANRRISLSHVDILLNNDGRNGKSHRLDGRPASVELHLVHRLGIEEEEVEREEEGNGEAEGTGGNQAKSVVIALLLSSASSAATTTTMSMMATRSCRFSSASHLTKIIAEALPYSNRSSSSSTPSGALPFLEHPIRGSRRIIRGLFTDSSSQNPHRPQTLPNEEVSRKRRFYLEDAFVYRGDAATPPCLEEGDVQWIVDGQHHCLDEDTLQQLRESMRLGRGGGGGGGEAGEGEATEDAENEEVALSNRIIRRYLTEHLAVAEEDAREKAMDQSEPDKENAMEQLELEVGKRHDIEDNETSVNAERQPLTTRGFDEMELVEGGADHQQPQQHQHQQQQPGEVGEKWSGDVEVDKDEWTWSQMVADEDVTFIFDSVDEVEKTKAEGKEAEEVVEEEEEELEEDGDEGELKSKKDEEAQEDEKSKDESSTIGVGNLLWVAVCFLTSLVIFL